MKVIDLLNKIANGEEVPNVIEFNDIIYKKADIGEDYYNFTMHKWFFKDVFDASGVNLELKTIEEEKKIPEKIEEEEIEVSMAIGEQICANKINAIIDYLQYLKSKGE